MEIGLAMLVALLANFSIVAAALPALPVDETRYLTVAWEMRASGNWIVPTLNFAPYSHKPPLLFWLINASWSLFGLSVWPARLVAILTMGCVLALTHRLDRDLLAKPAPVAASSVPVLLSLPLFVALGVAILFDMALTATVVGAMLALWRVGRRGSRRAHMAYGVCVGLGLLIKGPVVLVFTLPPALLGPTWVRSTARRGWYLRLALALGLAASIGLAWALPAAHLGGRDYAEMLLWTQSAGRVASSFSHARPMWFYLPVLLGFMAPLLLWRPTWIGLRRVVASASPARNFLLAWIVPPLALLSLISGKQMHYLLPIVPAAALLVSLGVKDAETRSADRWPLIVLVAGMLAGLVVVAWSGDGLLPDGSALAVSAKQLSVPLLIATGAIVLFALLVWESSIPQFPIAMATVNLVLLTSIALQSRARVAELFDLAPVAEVIAPFARAGRPIAVTERTRGEFGFLARLERPLLHVPGQQLPCWLSRHPESVAIIRSKADADRPAGYDMLYAKRYRMLETIAVVSAPSNRGEAPASLADACGATLGGAAPAASRD
ncbi:ArnT family glycosyltransferase [Hyphomicrobium sp.]|uniref:ArnT family glycosyltransferase n=1 Tax=Hyphomicrobium sp. TaxID=82 RepID=UPI003D0BADE9